MSKKQYIEIGEHSFEMQRDTLKKPKKWYINNYANLKECYNKPSTIKRQIFYDWLDWYRNNSEDLNYSDFGIRSYNCMFFSLEGYIWFHGKPYYFYITYGHNRIWKIET